MNKLLLSVATAATLFSVDSKAANSFDMFGDHDKLKGMVILEVGRANILRSSTGLSIASQTTMQMGVFCFSTAEPINDEAIMLISDKNRNAFIAKFTTSILDIKVKLHPVAVLDCKKAILADPNATQSPSSQTNDVTKRVLEDILRRQKELQLR